MQNNLLNREVAHTYKGQSAGGVQVVIGLVILEIVIIVVGVPVIDEAISDASFTGTTKTIAEVIPVLMILMGLVAIAGAMYLFFA